MSSVEVSARRAAIEAKALCFAYDVATGMVAMFVAPHIVFMFAGGAAPTWLEFFVAIAFGVTAAFAMWLRGVHRQVWRHTSLRDVVRIFQAVALTHLMSLPILILAKTLENYPIASDADPSSSSATPARQSPTRCLPWPRRWAAKMDFC